MKILTSILDKVQMIIFFHKQFSPLLVISILIKSFLSVFLHLINISLMTILYFNLIFFLLDLTVILIIRTFKSLLFHQEPLVINFISQLILSKTLVTDFIVQNIISLRNGLQLEVILVFQFFNIYKLARWQLFVCNKTLSCLLLV
jgi:hypothetical protein